MIAALKYSPAVWYKDISRFEDESVGGSSEMCQRASSPQMCEKGRNHQAYIRAAATRPAIHKQQSCGSRKGWRPPELR
jgi:hypothetical protein